MSRAPGLPPGTEGRPRPVAPGRSPRARSCLPDARTSATDLTGRSPERGRRDGPDGSDPMEAATPKRPLCPANRRRPLCPANRRRPLCPGTRPSQKQRHPYDLRRATPPVAPACAHRRTPSAPGEGRAGSAAGARLRPDGRRRAPRRARRGAPGTIGGSRAAHGRLRMGPGPVDGDAIAPLVLGHGSAVWVGDPSGARRPMIPRAPRSGPGATSGRGRAVRGGAAGRGPNRRPRPGRRPVIRRRPGARGAPD
jgi:hypothetical protein